MFGVFLNLCRPNFVEDQNFSPTYQQWWHGGASPAQDPFPFPLLANPLYPLYSTHYTHYIGPTIPTIPTFPRLTRPPAVLVTPQFLSPIPGSLFSYTRLTIPSIALNHPTAESVMPIPFRVLPYDCCAYHVKPIHVWSELGGNLSFCKVQTTCTLNCPDGTHLWLNIVQEQVKYWSNFQACFWKKKDLSPKWRKKIHVQLVFDMWQKSDDNLLAKCRIWCIRWWLRRCYCPRPVFVRTQPSLLDITFPHIPPIPSSDIEPRALDRLWGCIKYLDILSKPTHEWLWNRKFPLHTPSQKYGLSEFSVRYAQTQTRRGWHASQA